MEKVEKHEVRADLEKVAKALALPVRWLMLAKLAEGGPMAVKDVAKAVGLKGPAASKNMRILYDAGLVVVGAGRLYTIAPAFQPAPGSSDLRLGPCTLHFRAAAGGE